MSTSSTPAKPRSGWAQPHGGGIRRDHTVDCPRTADRLALSGKKCRCPFSWWMPQVGGQPRKRARHYGSLGQARTIKRQQEVDAQTARVDAAATHGSVIVNEGHRAVFDYYARWLRHDEKRLAPGTITERARVYERHLHATFGAARVADVSPQMIEDWLHAQQQAAVTYWPTRTAFNSLAAMLSTAAKKRHIEWNPTLAVDLPPEPVRDRRDHLTTDEYRAVLDACQTDEERLWIRLAGEAGLRRGEIAGLAPERVDVNACELLVSVNVVQVRGVGLVERPPKGGKPRIVAVSRALADALSTHIDAEHIATDAYLFTSPTDGGAVKPDYLTERIGKVIVRAGLADDERKPLFHLHDLRRTAATLARERGVAVDVIRDQLGHGHERMTNRHYIRARANPRLGEFAAAMEGVAQGDRIARRGR